MSLGLNMSSTIRLVHPFILAGIAYAATTNPINMLGAILEASVPDDTDVLDDVSDIELSDSASVIGIYHASYGADHLGFYNTIADMVTESGHQRSPLLSLGSPASIGSSGSARSGKLARYPSFRMPRSPPKALMSHWNQDVSECTDENTTASADDTLCASAVENMPTPVAPTESSLSSYAADLVSPARFVSAWIMKEPTTALGHESHSTHRLGDDLKPNTAASLRIVSTASSMFLLAAPPNTPCVKTSYTIPVSVSGRKVTLNLNLADLDLRVAALSSCATTTSRSTIRRFLGTFGKKSRKPIPAMSVTPASPSSPRVRIVSGKASKLRSAKTLRSVFRNRAATPKDLALHA